MSDQSDPFGGPLDKAHHDRYERHKFGEAFPYPDTPVPSNPGDSGSPGKTGIPADAGHIHPREAATTVTQPVGIVAMTAANTPPTGWLICNGQAVSRVTYAALFALIGTTYGIGDGSTTFNIPDLKARFPLGADGVTYTLGLAGGAFTKNHHHTHNHGGVTGNDSGGGQAVQAGVGTNVPLEPHTHTINNDLTDATVDVTPPFLALNFIIKY